MAQLRFPPVRALPELRYVRAPEPLDFPEEALMPESKTHLVLRTFLFRLLRFALGPAHRVGSEQFLYWNAADTTVSLAPDAMVRLNVPDARFKTWKTWEEGGVPDLAIEVVSDSDRRGWSEKLSDYRAIGVKELVRFDPAAPEGKRLRVWDRVREDLVAARVDTIATTPRRSSSVSVRDGSAMHERASRPFRDEDRARRRSGRKAPWRSRAAAALRRS
jgi:Uma2 family endonuclease